MNFIHAVKLPENKTDSCYALVFFNNELIIKRNNSSIELPVIKYFNDLQLQPVRTQYLGKYNNLDCFSAELSEKPETSEGYEFRSLRSLLGVLSDEDFYIAGKAIQICNWDANHQYCGKCSTKLETKPNERVKVCPACGLTNYPRISPAVIVAIKKDGKILLCNARRFNPKFYSILAGFVEAGETLEECVKREVKEEVNIEVKNIQYFGSQPWPFPDSLMVGFTAEYESGELKPDGDEILDAQWFAPTEMPNTPGKWSIAGKLINAFIEESLCDH